jgi:nifR3 family TIM-barrel protein
MEWMIGNVKIKNQVVLSPMAGVCNEVFRIICHEQNAGLVVCEMVSDKALMFKNEKTLSMTKVEDKEHPVSLQIFGSDIESMVGAAKFIDQNSNCDIIDINMGCPVPKVVKTGAGSALLQDPKKAYEIVKAVVEAVKKPVTVKIRIGFDKEHINCVEMAKLIEKAGAKAITVHARTRSEFYEGHSHWEYIKQVVDAVSIPVIGNGDITNAKEAKQMLDETGCMAVAIGRGSLGNPWIFNEVTSYLENGTILEKPTNLDKYNMIVRQHEMLEKLKGTHLALVEMRSHIGWYLRGIPGAGPVKNECNICTDFSDVLKILRRFLLSEE